MLQYRAAMASTKRILFSTFTDEDTRIADIDMPTDESEAREVNSGMRIGRLPVHGAEIKGELVEKCPGSERFTGILDDLKNIGACEICSVEFSVTPERKKK